MSKIIYTDWSHNERNSKCLLLLAMNSESTIFRIPRVFEIVSSFVKTALPPRSPTNIRRVGVLEHNLCRVMVFPMPSHMSRSFTIEFWMRLNFTNNLEVWNSFFHLDFGNNMKPFTLSLSDSNCGKDLYTTMMGPSSVFSSNVPYGGWLHFSLSFQVGEKKDTLSYRGIVSRSTNVTKKSVGKCFERKEIGGNCFINTEGRPSRFILASPGICGGCYSDVRLWAFPFHHPPAETPPIPELKKPNWKGRLVGSEEWLLHYWPLDEVSGSIARNICTDRRASQDATRFAKSHEKQSDLIEKYKIFIQLTAANGSEDSHAKFGYFKDQKDEFVLSTYVPAFINTEGSEGATMFALAYLFQHPTTNFGTSRIQRYCLGNMKLSKLKDKTNPEHLKHWIWRVYCDEKVMTTKGLVTVKYIVDVNLKKCGASTWCSSAKREIFITSSITVLLTSSRTILIVFLEYYVDNYEYRSYYHSLISLSIPKYLTRASRSNAGTERHFSGSGIKVHPSCQIGFLDPSSLKVVRTAEKYEFDVEAQQSKIANWIVEYCRMHTPKDFSSLSRWFPIVKSQLPDFVMGRPLKDSMQHDNTTRVVSSSSVRSEVLSKAPSSSSCDDVSWSFDFVNNFS